MARTHGGASSDDGLAANELSNQMTSEMMRRWRAWLLRKHKDPVRVRAVALDTQLRRSERERRIATGWKRIRGTRLYLPAQTAKALDIPDKQRS